MTTTHPFEALVEGVAVRGTLHLPDSTGPHAVVVAGHGWGMTADGDLQDYAAVFAGFGLAVATFDFRGLGRSDGMPRQDLDPWQQIEDYKQVVSWARTDPRLDPERIGVWGSSFAGGHVLVVAATDPRVRCAVAQVPMINGHEAGQLRSTPAAVHRLAQQFVADREGRFAGRDAERIVTVSEDPSAPVAYPGPDSYDYMMAEGERSGTWLNWTTLRSVERARSYDPGAFIERIAPTPLLMIVADQDEIGPALLQQRAYSRALGPRKLLLVPGGHYTPYREHFTQCADAAGAWFARHLSSTGS